MISWLVCTEAAISAPNAEAVFVTERKFENNYILGAIDIEFRKDFTYSIDYGSEGRYWKESGEWRFEKGEVLLTPSTCEYDEYFEKGYKCSGSFGGGRCKIEKNEKSLEFFLRLNCQSAKNKDIGWGRNYITFDVKGSKISSGTEIIFENYPIVTLGGIEGKVVETLNLRAGPSVDSKRIDYMPADFYDNPNYPKSAPKGTKIKILARTKEKSQVKTDKDYWYCIRIGALSNVWVFGKFITYTP